METKFQKNSSITTFEVLFVGAYIYIYKIAKIKYLTFIYVNRDSGFVHDIRHTIICMYIGRQTDKKNMDNYSKNIYCLIIPFSILNTIFVFLYFK